MKNSNEFYKQESENDPHTFSPYPKNIELSATGKKVPHASQDYPVYVDTKTGDTYVEKLEKYSPPRLEEDSRKERFISLLTKGVLRSSDMIEKEGRFFSKVIDIDKTSATKTGELFANLATLKNLFEDPDRSIKEDTDEPIAYAKATRLHKEGVQEHSNIIIRGDKFVHFDYHTANFNKNWLNTKKAEDEFKRMVTRNIKMDKLELFDFSPNKEKEQIVLNQFWEKIEEINERLLDKKFFDSIIKESKIDSLVNESLTTKNGESGADNLRGDLIKKTNILLDVINDLKNENL